LRIAIINILSLFGYFLGYSKQISRHILALLHLPQVFCPICSLPLHLQQLSLHLAELLAQVLSLLGQLSYHLLPSQQSAHQQLQSWHLFLSAPVFEQAFDGSIGGREVGDGRRLSWHYFSQRDNLLELPSSKFLADTSFLLLEGCPLFFVSLGHFFFEFECLLLCPAQFCF